MSRSLELAGAFLGLTVEVVMDRPLGSRHPCHEDVVYKVNYGYVPGTRAPDGAELDAYYLGVDEPLARARGVCVALIHRLDDDDDKLVIVPFGTHLTDAQIIEAVGFQERFFQTEIVRREEV